MGHVLTMGNCPTAAVVVLQNTEKMRFKSSRQEEHTELTN